MERAVSPTAATPRAETPMKTKTKVKAGGLSTSPIGVTPPRPFGP